MTATAIREKLYDYIRIADDKKVKAIYMMLEDEITEQIEWWKDKDFTDALNKEFAAWKSGKDKGYTLAEIEESVTNIKNMRKIK